MHPHLKHSVRYCCHISKLTRVSDSHAHVLLLFQTPAAVDDNDNNADTKPSVRSTETKRTPSVNASVSGVSGDQMSLLLTYMLGTIIIYLELGVVLCQ